MTREIEKIFDNQFDEIMGAISLFARQINVKIQKVFLITFIQNIKMMLRFLLELNEKNTLKIIKQ